MKPKEPQIHQTVTLIRAKLAKTASKKRVNQPVREGYEAALKILVEWDTEKGYPAELVMLPDSVQGRAIADMAYDYLIGVVSQNQLTGVQWQ